MKAGDFHIPLIGGMTEIQCSDSNFTILNKLSCITKNLVYAIICKQCHEI